ncbi:FIST C-terminal domain-containing protein [Chitinimonas koreensis]|uniref:FIST C-terminal domain-containing protein n=1 Tax=Chitinimonas koreensis TaxID=356302 RepID=UPI00042A8B54|nr:FIST C-terminal domain-containing protein [Chitinimonas koreensis]QNM97498.1 FIST C-terminal domain-containing protein [Chitinimonas koreensis]
MPYASGLAQSTRPSPQLAAQAVEQALQRLERPRADAVLLFLSADFAQDPRPALVAAARAGQTLAVTGCTALGVLTEDDWVLDAPAACALAIADMNAAGDEPPAPRLTLAAPNTLDLGWLEQGPQRFGGVAGDATGLGPYKVWRHGQLAGDGRCELALPGAQVHVSLGLSQVGRPFQVTETDGFDLRTLDGRMASATLRRSLDPLPPLHELALAVLDDDGRPSGCWPLVSLNPDGSVTVAARLTPGMRVAWMGRSAAAALDELRAIARQPTPAAALMFSCGSRGPALHGGLDAEWQALVGAWPATPLAGFYGNAQIATLGASTRLLHQSVVVAALR